jgi:co-chaperonin GroES (HSP10)
VIKPFFDWLLVALEPERRQHGLLQLVGPQAVRTGRVLSCGPGRQVQKTGQIVPMDVRVGERVCFFAALRDTGQGKAIGHVLEDDQALIRESDVLFVLLDPKLEVDR